MKSKRWWDLCSNSTAITAATVVAVMLASIGCGNSGAWIVGKYHSNHAGAEVEWELKSNGNFSSTIIGGKNLLGGAIEEQPPSIGTWKLNGDMLFINSSDNFSKENTVTQTADGFELRTGKSGLKLKFTRVQ